MSEVGFRSREFGDGAGHAVVALVAGFDGKITHFEQAAQDFVVAGSDVIAYEYDNDVFLAGDGSMLPALIKDLSADFANRSINYGAQRCAGASLGGGIGWNMQKDLAYPQPGLYAAIGANVAHLVMVNPVFRGVVRAVHKIDIRKEFMCNGYSEADLNEVWHELQLPPRTPFAVALGGLDCVIKKREVMPKFKEWQQDIDIHIWTQKRMGHTGIIKWFNNNIPAMIELADMPKGNRS